MHGEVSRDCTGKGVHRSDARHKGLQGDYSGEHTRDAREGGER